MEFGPDFYSPDGSLGSGFRIVGFRLGVQGSPGHPQELSCGSHCGTGAVETRTILMAAELELATTEISRSLAVWGLGLLVYQKLA